MIRFLILFIFSNLLFAEEYQVKQGAHSTAWYNTISNACKASASFHPAYEHCGQFLDWYRCSTRKGESYECAQNTYLTVTYRPTDECDGYHPETGLCQYYCEDGYPEEIPELEINTCDRRPIQQCPDNSYKYKDQICDTLPESPVSNWECMDALSCYNYHLDQNPDCIQGSFDYESPSQHVFTCELLASQYTPEPEGPTSEELRNDLENVRQNPNDNYDSSGITASDIGGSVQASLLEDFDRLERAINNQTNELIQADQPMLDALNVINESIQKIEVTGGGGSAIDYTDSLDEAPVLSELDSSKQVANDSLTQVDSLLSLTESDVNYFDSGMADGAETYVLSLFPDNVVCADYSMEIYDGFTFDISCLETEKIRNVLGYILYVLTVIFLFDLITISPARK